MRPSFVMWIRKVGYFPYLLLADISIMIMSVGLPLYFLGSLDALIILPIYLLATSVEYGLAYFIYTKKHPIPSGVYFLVKSDDVGDIFAPKEDLDNHITYSGRSEQSISRLNEN